VAPSIVPPGGALGAILEGGDPQTGEKLRVRPVEVTGFDVTFSPPKASWASPRSGECRLSDRATGLDVLVSPEQVLGS
jgi:hypothetical protein